MPRVAIAIFIALTALTVREVHAQARYPAATRQELDAALAAALARDDHRDAGWVALDIGWQAFQNSDLAEAGRTWQLALEEMDRAGDVRGRVTVRLAQIYLEEGGPSKDQHIRDGLAAARELGDPALEGGFLHKRGEQEALDGRYADAVDTLTRAIACWQRTDRRDSEARSLGTLARVYLNHGHPARAIELQRRALTLTTQAGSINGMVSALNAVANSERRLGHLNLALQLQRRAVALARRVAGTRTLGFQRVQLAEIYNELRRYRDAVRLAEEVVRDGDAFSIRLAYDTLSFAHLALGDAQRAYDSADRAVALAVEPAAMPWLLESRARAAYRLGRIGEALADVRDALHRAEASRQQLVPADSMKQGFAELQRALFDFAIQLLHERGSEREALAVAEQARARAFLDLLASRDRSGESHVVAGDLDSVASAAPFTADDLVATARRLQSTVLSYWVTPNATLVWTVHGDGTIHAAVSRISASRLRRLIARVSAPSTGTSARRGGEVLLTSRQASAVVAGQTPRAVWRELYAALIAPVERNLPRQAGSLLTIEPHGPLFRLSFAGLLDPRDRYLLERYTIHYVPADGVLAYAGHRAEDHSSQQYLLVASPHVPPVSRTIRLSPLPGARRELAGIARLLPRESVRVLTGADASEARVRDAAATGTVLHFATHAVLRDDAPLESFLALDATSPRGSDDGRLTVREIYDWRIAADLVVLSACRTALGRVTGDGVLGMTRAFFYAGASSVVATLWDVVDEPAVDVMRTFYARWQRPAAKAVALREAQLRLLRELRAGRVTAPAASGRAVLPEDPMLWAAFVLVGAP